MRYHYTPRRMAEMKRLTVTTLGSVRRNRSSYTALVGMEMLWPPRKHIDSFLQWHIRLPYGPAIPLPGIYPREKEILLRPALASGAQLVGASSWTPKGHRFDIRSGHIPRLRVWPPVRAHMGRQPIDFSPSHGCFSSSSEDLKRRNIVRSSFICNSPKLGITQMPMNISTRG